MRKLTFKLVEQIRTAYFQGISVPELAEQFELGLNTVADIVYHRVMSWHETPPKQQLNLLKERITIIDKDSIPSTPIVNLPRRFKHSPFQIGDFIYVAVTVTHSIFYLGKYTTKGVWLADFYGVYQPPAHQLKYKNYRPSSIRVLNEQIEWTQGAIDEVLATYVSYLQHQKLLKNGMTKLAHILAKYQTETDLKQKADLLTQVRELVVSTGLPMKWLFLSPTIFDLLEAEEKATDAGSILPILHQLLEP